MMRLAQQLKRILFGLMVLVASEATALIDDAAQDVSDHSGSRIALADGEVARASGSSGTSGTSGTSGSEAAAFSSSDKVGNKAFVIGPKVRFGGRFDDVRMCVASPAGTKGGMAADISLSTEIAFSDTVSLEMDLPVFRPIMFGLSFQMLQFEPSVSLRFRKQGNRSTDFVFGPMLGVSFHYGPDYKSDNTSDGRGPSFFAMGPMVGGYIGVDFTRPRERYNFQLGMTPYVTPLFGIADDQNYLGVVAGGLVDFSFRFGKPNAK